MAILEGNGGDARFPRMEALALPDKTLQRQLYQFLDGRADFLSRNLELGDYDEKELGKRQAFLREFSNVFLTERLLRAEEISSSKVKSAVEVFEHWLPYHTYGVVCYDGRLGAAVIFGIPGGYGGFLRTKGGDLSHFDIGADGELVIDEGSNIGLLLKEVEEKEEGQSCQVLDSHIGCAARARIEQKRGKAGLYDDGGLLKDVQRKKGFATSFEAKGILPIQFSSDPHHGYGFMGLEREEAMNFAKTRRGFTPEVRNELVKMEAVISTEDIADEHLKFFQNLIVHIDWESEYATSSYEFAQRLDLILKSEVYEEVRDKVVRVFGGDSEDKLSDDEIQQRTVLIIANAFNGFLQNRSSEKGYSYDSHEEQCVVILEGGFGPYKVTKELPIAPGDNFLGDTDFAQFEIIRGNRAERKTIKDFTGVYHDDEFLSAPVPVYLLGIVKGRDAKEVDEHDWESVINIDWSNLPENWYDMEEEHFGIWLEDRGVTHAGMIRTINTLRDRFAKMCRRGDISRLVADGSLEVIPVIVDQNRKPRSIPNLKFEGVSVSPAA
ncbi:hypothetical protein A3G67_05050 [Candidatus Roizmanbacteria bacterium RIFCSPLOWO2_12_FULL_40_12]|uniref:Uncharacterized protein n=1 Tax=Candidatus Roizmanbacteria bacterium RIFCSPLOWO2_01_FULL_40_42 TaxID=1802066 RepID=A0A1F7J4F6_9BACT|nr:MAG: hypothetical protein A2779_04100 [Candidatus Roizmanbacteria bacterium RIFCSPHIGHO2_01_FULL_40_98]OGK27260.1 MAG: hypothetical protein A3C31_04425 [Candidatus Roizmanbacteria bacterium RIFCSPHIGHO2_02_FULL_40_53]OGK30868.1 MAG: hypothetical protein A2W49_02615 [Candidatus Roizmanbacteria bacterium RIFCSPHIGHO2_12_41_18]OGK36365.1 MAG: hypothetical protein A3E69_02050 [Candidatus Roizmanbacteria bacterium RIFCSPHIGHO2_12_FULL_40_130]OGK50493.1 MAG: hypothetical protein A3B50_01780 [Candi